MSARSTIERAEAALRERFGLAELRPWQTEAVQALLDGPGQALVVAPTGGGKSLTYQLPAVLLDGLTLVVSPLISLMEDQVRSLERRGIPATFLASTLDPDERNARWQRIRKGEVQLAYVAPERLSDGLASLVEGRLALLAIDEAHCVVQWGHDFRPHYLEIRGFLERVRPPRVLACTATATSASQAAIVEALGLDPARTATIVRGFARPNLALSVVEVDGPRAARLLATRTLDRVLGDRKKPRGAAIVYAGTRKGTEKLAEELAEGGFRVGAYHAGMDAEQRTRVADAFAARELDLVVATNAFGMGIDRPDVRVVIHTQPPGSIEAYYQEVGRAGRDGDSAEAVMYFAPIDISTRRRLIEMGSGGEPADPQQVARQWALYRDLLRFVDAQSCRHDFVLRYFGDEAESLGGCGHCDVCDRRADVGDDPTRIERDGEVVRKALAGVARANRRGGMAAIAQMLAGLRNERTERFGFTELSTYGLLEDRGELGAMQVLRSCIAAGYVGLSSTEHPVPFLTQAGARVMKGEQPSEILLREVVRGGRAPSRVLGPKSATKSRGKGSAARDAALEGVDVFVKARFDRLRAVRGRLAKEHGVPPYVVAHDRALFALAEAAPSSTDELVGVPGWGPAKASRWGGELLAALHDPDA